MVLSKLEKLILVAGASVLIPVLVIGPCKPKSRFTDYQQEFFERNHVPLERAESYNKRFMSEDIADLTRANVLPHIADLYDARFDGGDIASFVKNHISPEVAKGYLNTRFENFAWALANANILPETALEYDKRFDDRAVLELAKERSQPEKSMFAESNFAAHEGIPAKVANSYHENLKVYEIIMLHNEGIGPAKANDYVKVDSRFDGSRIAQLSKNNVSAEVAGQYSALFPSAHGYLDVANIIFLISNDVASEEAQKFFGLNNKYGVNIGSDDIVHFKKSGIPFEEVEKEAKRYMFDKLFEK